jgi:hypothetical protein
MNPDEIAALVMLAGCPDGATEAALQANRIWSTTLLALVRQELVSPHRTIVAARNNGRDPGFVIYRFRITPAGRHALAKHQH